MIHERPAIKEIARRRQQETDAITARIGKQFGNFSSYDRPRGLSRGTLIASGIAGTGTLLAAGIASQINADPTQASVPEPTPIHRGIPADIQKARDMLTPYVEASIPITDSFRNLNVTPEWLAQNPLKILDSNSTVDADGNVKAKYELNGNGFLYKSEADATGVLSEYKNTSSTKIPIVQPRAFSVSPDGKVIVAVGSDNFDRFSSAMSDDGGITWRSLGTSASDGGAESVNRLDQYTFLVTLNTTSSAVRILRADPRAQTVEPLSDPNLTNAPRELTITSLNESTKNVQWFATNRNGGLNFTTLNYDKNTATEQNIQSAMVDGELTNLGNLNALFVYEKDGRQYALTSNNQRGLIYKLDVNDLSNITGTKHSFSGLTKDKVANYGGGEGVNAIYGKFDQTGRFRISIFGRYQSEIDAISRAFAAYYAIGANFSIDKTTLVVDDFVPNQVSVVAKQRDVKPETINGQFGLNVVVKNTIGKLFRLLNPDGSPGTLILRPNKGLEKVIALATATPTITNTPTSTPSATPRPVESATPTPTRQPESRTPIPPTISPVATVISQFKANVSVVLNAFQK